MALEPARDFLMTPAGGMAIVRGDFAVARGAAAVPQGIQVRVRMFLGECLLDGSLGVDWLGQILIKNPNPLVVRELVSAAIAATPDVVNVAGTLPSIAPDRSATIGYQVATTHSTTHVVGAVQVSG